jgi:hypothetical protein
MHELWRGQPPSERAPELKTIVSTASKKEIVGGSEFTAQAEATDPDGDALTYHWTVTPQTAGRDSKGKERKPVPLELCVVKAEANSATFHAPEKPGAYRVHLRVIDTRNRAATGNFPFMVK